MAAFYIAPWFDNNPINEWVENRLRQEHEKGNYGKKIVAAFAYIFCKVMLIHLMMSPIRTVMFRTQLSAWHEPSMPLKVNLWNGFWMDVAFAFARNAVTMYFIQ